MVPPRPHPHLGWLLSERVGLSDCHMSSQPNSIARYSCSVPNSAIWAARAEISLALRSLLSCSIDTSPREFIQFASPTRDDYGPWVMKPHLAAHVPIQDLRRVMEPNTATHLRESKKNILKDFVSVAGPLGVSHFMILTATKTASYLRVAKTPRGPTLTMKARSGTPPCPPVRVVTHEVPAVPPQVHEYSLMRDVVGSQTRPRCPPTAFRFAPLVVMNNFGSDEHLK